jgi:hypothetical protein
MIRIITISTLLLLLLAKPAVQFGWEVWYYVNQEYVAEELCENQDRPELDCNGQCYLMKQLALSEGNDDSSNEEQQVPVNPFKLKVETPICAQTSFFDIASDIEKNKKQDRFYYSDYFSLSHISEIFHPPQV